MLKYHYPQTYCDLLGWLNNDGSWVNMHWPMTHRPIASSELGWHLHSAQRLSIAGEVIWEHKKHQNSWRAGLRSRLTALPKPQAAGVGGCCCPSPKTTPPISALRASSPFRPRNWGPLTYCWTKLPQSLAAPLHSYYRADRVTVGVTVDSLSAAESDVSSDVMCGRASSR